MEIRNRQCSFMFSGHKIEMTDNANRNRNEEEEEVENGATTVSNNNMVLSTSCRIRKMYTQRCSFVRCESTYFMYTHKCVTLHIYIDATAHTSKSKNTFTQWMRRESPQSRLTCIPFFFIDTSSEFSCTKNRIIVYTLEYTHFTTLTTVACLCGCVCVRMSERAYKRRRLWPQTKHYCRIKRNFLSVKLNQHRVGHGRIVSDQFWRNSQEKQRKKKI